VEAVEVVVETVEAVLDVVDRVEEVELVVDIVEKVVVVTLLVVVEDEVVEAVELVVETVEAVEVVVETVEAVLDVVDRVEEVELVVDIVEKVVVVALLVVVEDVLVTAGAVVVVLLLVEEVELVVDIVEKVVVVVVLVVVVVDVVVPCPVNLNAATMNTDRVVVTASAEKVPVAPANRLTASATANPVSAPEFDPRSKRSIHVPAVGSVVVFVAPDAVEGSVAASNNDVNELSPCATIATSNSFDSVVVISVRVGSPIVPLVAAPPVW
jgi:hypothetical protein